ncbi:GNAT family N-acetyltransferase [Xylanibacter muris]|uniref:GNAT family N-acetyltransferase n=1 Tax=Xylanibacter muris TaxID=2736290 RepID=A0ABX2APQ5_9BACT|nr:GNAT family N-acetyltransferase [Xylanibacter muris]NPD92964.1 GNAT family N-acetyltransferase [Xylanibacter muris]
MIETERLILRHWRTDDAEALYKYASDRRVSDLALWPCHDSIGMSREVIKNIFAPNPYSFAMVLKDTNEPIGCIGLVPYGNEHHPLTAAEREVGYWIGHPYWGCGLTTEALKGLIGFCRDNMTCRSLLITTDVRNTASQRVAEKCGFRFLEDYKYEGMYGKAYRLNLRTG